MRVFSEASFSDPHKLMSRNGHEFGPLLTYVWSQIKRYLRKLNRIMTAIAYAEAGNLDEVQKILDENMAMNKLENSPVGNSRMAGR